MIKTGLPMTLIYQDRGTLELNKYELHLDDKFNLYINNIIYSEFNLGEIIQNINLMYEEIIVNGKAPARSYKIYSKRRKATLRLVRRYLPRGPKTYRG